MNINEAQELLNSHGLQANRIMQYCSTDFSILHAEACKNFLKYPLGLHEYYCDMKRLEKVGLYDIAIALYSPISGFSTEIKTESNALNVAIQLIEAGMVEQVLIFELTHHKTVNNLLPVPAGNVYQIVK